MPALVCASLVAASLLVACSSPAQTPAPDLILHHGHIFTADSASPWVEAIAIRGDRIVAVGANDAVLPRSDKHTQVIDLHGRMAMPGINDSHDHVGGAPFGVELHFPPVQSRWGLAPDPSIEELATAVRTAAATAHTGVWIQAEVGPAIIRHPAEARAVLDKAAAGHPVAVEAWWGHGVLLNTAGLAKLGISDAAKDMEGGHYDRDAAGHLTGLLEEEAGNEVRRRLTDMAGVEPSIGLFKKYAAQRLAQGVTSVQVMATNQRLSYLENTFVDAKTPLRVRIMRFPMAAEDARAGETLKSGEEVLSSRVRVAGIKYVLDGTPIEELAYQTKDYPDKPGWRGRSDYSAGFIDRQLKVALNGKDQLMMHIVGDAMTDQVMDQMEKLAPAETWRPLRVRFEHGDGFNTSERIARAQKLGIVVAQPRPGRLWRSLVDGGIPLAYGSDGGMAPWFMFSIMTDAKNPQHIPTADALRILTSGPAFAEFQETRKGSLRAGMLADVIVLSQDVTAAPPAPLPATHSVMTIVGGQVALRSPEFDAPVRNESPSSAPSPESNHP